MTSKWREKIIDDSMKSPDRWCYNPLDLSEWESMHVDAEVAIFRTKNEYEKWMLQFAKHIHRLSEEVRRLRHKCGEKVWLSVSTTPEQDEFEKNKCKET